MTTLKINSEWFCFHFSSECSMSVHVRTGILTWQTRRVLCSAGWSPAGPYLSPGHPALSSLPHPAERPGLVPAAAPDWIPTDRDNISMYLYSIYLSISCIYFCSMKNDEKLPATQNNEKLKGARWWWNIKTLKFTISPQEHHLIKPLWNLASQRLHCPNFINAINSLAVR